MMLQEPRVIAAQEWKNCRSCGSGNLDSVLDLGTHAISDFYLPSELDREDYAPLHLIQCGACGLVQLTHSVPKDRLYRSYYYRSSTNPAMVAALKDVVDDAMGRINYDHSRYEWTNVLDIGANDGTLLDQYPRPSRFQFYGIEPSDLASVGFRNGNYITRGYYPDDRWNFGDTLPRIITSIAMFYDLDDPNAFVKAIKEDLHPEGIWVNQMMDIEEMTYANAFDNICHEHVAYWSVGQFSRLLAPHGLEVVSTSINSVNGGSRRTIARHMVDGPKHPSPIFYDFMKDFSQRIARLKESCLDFLFWAKANHKTVLGYGASTKGNTLLQYYGIDTDLLPAIAERNPDKVGKLTAGSHIPIISEEEMRQRKPDYLLVLPWSQPFLDGFLEREKDLIAQGTRLVAPLPTFRVIGG